MTLQATPPLPADFWFDPACPWAWLTSRWALEVEKVRPVRFEFRLMSLAVLNQDKDLSDETVLRLMGPVRVIQAAIEGEGQDAARVLYTEMGNRKHPGQRPLTTDVVAEAVTAAGYDTKYAEAFDSTEYDEAITKSHHEGMALVGYDVGTPVIRVEDDSFFGPVVTPAPKGEAAGRLWDGFRLVGSTPGFYEIKRTRDVQPDFS
jgi:hypothetical protein